MPTFEEIQQALNGPHGDNATLHAQTAELVAKANFPKPDKFAAWVMSDIFDRCDTLKIPPPSDSLAIEYIGAIAGIYSSEQLGELPPNPGVPGWHAETIWLGQIRDILLHQRAAALDRGGTLAELANVFEESFLALLRHVPHFPAGDAGYTLRLLDLIPDVGRAIEDVTEPFFSTKTQQLGLFAPMRNTLINNRTDVREKAGRTKDIRPSDYKGSAAEIVRAFLKGALLDDVFLEAEIPFAIPEEQRFAGHWIVAPPGRGKTTLLLSMFLEDVKRHASIIVLDSKGELIGPLKELSAIKDRLVLIEPDPDFPLALNPLDIPKANIAHTISLLEYIFSALLEAKMTALQMTLFRSVLPAIVEVVPNATLDTFRDIIENGISRYQQQFAKLSPDKQEFFARHFDSKTYSETRQQLVWRLQFLMTNPVIKQMFSALKTKLDIGREMDAGKIILIDNSKQRLGDEGSEFFGRFFIALVLAAAQQRAGRKQHEKLPCFFYIDECQSVIRRDEKISTILDECRSQKIAMIMAHQRTAQITNENVLDALANCAIRMANSDEEAKYLAPKLRCETEFLHTLPRGTFATYVRDLTPKAVALRIPHTDLSELPKTTALEQTAIQNKMRAMFSFDAASSQASRPQPPEQASTQEMSTDIGAAPSPFGRPQGHKSEVSDEAGGTW